MNLDEYLQSGETVFCQTAAKKGDGETNGELACTDYRLIYLKNGSVVDVDLNSIEEIEFDPNPIRWDKLAGAILSLLGGIAIWLIIPEIGFVPDVFSIFGVIAGVVMFIAFLVELYRYRHQTLKIKTSRSTRTFRGSGLSGFPHAIRGAGN